MEGMVQTKLIGLRKFQGLTQKDMAEVIEVDLRTYINKESGNRQFKLNEMFAIAQKLNAPIGDIFLPPYFIKHEVLAAEGGECSCNN